ncbi:hypothetical protein FB45DRAFT_997750 [Roridomyces roridus]|uniref:F-box domain-containing protein n=1 Tax=Roridomyces roridus TaxID=1738132 RepID=A0AAD7CKE1_9AGAR|nr:hypothetical protein FB45DRAFT_997750 [Roridomyces roridus]
MTSESLAVARARVRVAELDKEIERLQLSIHALCLEREKFQQTLADYKYPVLTLPTEITSEILTRFLPPWPQRPEFKGPYSPSFLLGICRQWRDVALSTPELWSTMRLDIKAPDGPQLRARELISLESWLQRSGDCPLSLDLSCVDMRVPSSSLQTSSSLQPFVDAILRHASRLQSLEICLPLDNLRSIKGSMPLLRSLTMGPNTELLDPAPSERRLHLFTDAPRMENLILFTFFNPFYIILPWAQITSVTASLYVYEAAEIMRNAAALEILIVVVYNVSEPNLPIAPIPPLSSLHTLVFKSFSGGAEESTGIPALFDALSLPALLSLSTYECFLGSDPVGAIASLRPTGCLLRVQILAASTSRGVYEKAFSDTEFVVEEVEEDEDEDESGDDSD